MKKVYELLLTVLMMFLLTACGSSVGDGTLSSTDLTYSSESSGSTTTSPENSADSTAQSETGNTTSMVAPESTSVEISIPTSTGDSEPETPKVLVAYFSATNTTKGVAKHISDALNADLYEIIPEIPYTSADLNYHDDGSRSTIEMNDSSSRPVISGSVNNMEQYDIVFIGYPIWWGDAPRILSTFVESYSFSGKIIVPFCTSGGSGVGSSASNLERLSDGGTWLSGTRLSGSASRNDVVSWINGLGLDTTAE